MTTPHQLLPALALLLLAAGMPAFGAAPRQGGAPPIVRAGDEGGQVERSARGGACERPPAPRRAAGEGPSAEEIEAARRRWEALAPEQRAQLAERYRRFQALGEHARNELHERASNLEHIEERLCRRLTPEERARLERLAPARRAEILREMVRSELESQGERLIVHLPDDLRARLAGAGEEDRLRYFQQFKLAVRERMSLSAIRHLGQELELPPEQVRALLELPGPLRVEAALELGKRLGRRDVERSGLPSGLSLERWREIEALPPADFYQEIVGLTSRPRRPTSGEAPPPLGRELRDALRPTRAQILDHADLPREERQRAIRVHQRPHLTTLLRESGILTPAQMAELEALPDGLFYGEVRRIARERGGLSEVLPVRGPDAGRGPGRGSEGEPGREGGERRGRPRGGRSEPPPADPAPGTRSPGAWRKP